GKGAQNRPVVGCLGCQESGLRASGDPAAFGAGGGGEASEVVVAARAVVATEAESPAHSEVRAHGKHEQRAEEQRVHNEAGQQREDGDAAFGGGEQVGARDGGDAADDQPARLGYAIAGAAVVPADIAPAEGGQRPARGEAVVDQGAAVGARWVEELELDIAAPAGAPAAEGGPAGEI